MAIKSLIKILIPVIVCLNYNSPKLLEAKEPQAFSAEEMASIFPDEWSDGWGEMVIGMTGFVKGRNRKFTKGSASVKLYKGIGEKTGSFDYFLMLQVKDAINKGKAWQEINKMIKQFTAYKPIMYNGNKGFLAKEKGCVNLIYGNGRFIIAATLSGQEEIPGRPIKFIEPVLQSLNLEKITKVKVEKEKKKIVYPGISPGIPEEFQKYMETQMPEEYREYLEKMKEIVPEYYDMYKKKAAEVKEEAPFDPKYSGKWEGKVNGTITSGLQGPFLLKEIVKVESSLKFTVSKFSGKIDGEGETKILSVDVKSSIPDDPTLGFWDYYPRSMQFKISGGYFDTNRKEIYFCGTGEGFEVRIKGKVIFVIDDVRVTSPIDGVTSWAFDCTGIIFRYVDKGMSLSISGSWRLNLQLPKPIGGPLQIREFRGNIWKVSDYAEEKEEIEEAKKLDANGDGRLDCWEYLVDLSPDKAEKGYHLDDKDDFSPRIHPITKKPSKHKGIDIQGNIGDTIRAAGDGYVYKIDTIGKDARGKRIVITHDDGYKSEYWHLTSLTVQEGDRIKAGQPIGTVGETGSTTGPHLHYGVKNPKGEWIDPVNDYFH